LIKALVMGKKIIASKDGLIGFFGEKYGCCILGRNGCGLLDVFMNNKNYTIPKDFHSWKCSLAVLN